MGQIWALDRNEVFVGWQRQKMSRADFFNCDIPTPPLDPELRDSYGSKVDGYDSPSDYLQVPWRDEPPW